MPPRRTGMHNDIDEARVIYRGTDSQTDTEFEFLYRNMLAHVRKCVGTHKKFQLKAQNYWSAVIPVNTYMPPWRTEMHN